MLYHTDTRDRPVAAGPDAVTKIGGINRNEPIEAVNMLLESWSSENLNQEL